MKKKNSFINLVLVSVIALALIGCGTKAAVKPADTAGSDSAKKPSVTVKLSSTSSKGGAMYEGAMKFKELVEERSKGDIEVQVFPDGQLAKDLAAIDAHKTGAIQMSLPSTAMAQIDPKFGVFDIPFLFKDAAAVAKFAHGEMWSKEFQPLFEKYGMVGLGFWENGFRHITNNKRPINTPEDLKGIKLRVPESKLRVAMFKEFGANPATSDFSEVFTALQQGVFDGQENPFVQIEAGRFAEVQKYLSLTNHTYTPAYLVASKVWFDKLKPEQQELLRKAAVDAGDYTREYGAKVESELLAKFKSQGMIVNTADVASFQAIGRPVIDVLPKSRCQNVLRTGKAEVGEIMEISRAKVVANNIPIKVDEKVEGVVTTFQSVDRLQSLEHKVRRTLADRGHVAKHSFSHILGQSQAIKDAVKWAREYAQVDSTVLLHGRTGSGKELFAQAIHNASPRRCESFVAINCAALPENLLESELFGYVEGAFTGARKGGKAGVFEIAHGGTLFLDEVGEMAPSLQARLLRVLEEGEVMRLGDNSILPVNVRLVAATHRDLKEMVEKGSFREDLFYRLNVLSLVVPELAERGYDIILIARHFLEEFGRKMRRSTGGLSGKAEQILLDYPWPGNIRELRNAMERLVMLTGEKEISEDDIARALNLDRKQTVIIPEREERLRCEVELAEIRSIQKALKECRGNKTETARRLGISRTTLWRKLQEAEDMS